MSAKTKQFKGRVKQAVGTLTGNKHLERQGKTDRLSAETSERIDKATDKVEEVIDKTADAVTKAIGTAKSTRHHK